MDTPGVQRTQARIVAVANQKSGNGKTTTAVNLASSLAASERRVLLVDMDPQANAGSGLGVIETGSNQNLYHVLMDGVPLSRVLVETRLDTLDVAPCSGDLVGAEVQWVSVASRGLRLQRALQSVSCHYDYIIIDSPSAFGVLTVNCLIAAHSVLIPVRAEYHALDGLGAVDDGSEPYSAGLQRVATNRGIFAHYEGSSPEYEPRPWRRRCERLSEIRCLR